MYVTSWKGEYVCETEANVPEATNYPFRGVSFFALLPYKPHSAVWFLLNNDYFFSTTVSSPFNIMYK